MARVLVTRPEPAATRTARRLTARGHRPIVAPMLVMRALALSPDIADGGEPVVALTSARAVEAVAGTPAWNRLAGRTFVAVGSATAEAARAAGAAEVIACGGTLETVVDRLGEMRPAGGVLYLAGRQRSGDLCARLADRGIACRMQEVYDMAIAPVWPEAARRAIEEAGPLSVLVYSRRSGEAAAAALSQVAAPGPVTFVAISEQAVEPVRHLGACRVAAAPCETELIALLDETC